jgi:hypothetical protein
MKKIILFITFSIIWLSNISFSHAQTISLDDISASPGENILVPVNFTNMNDIGTITLFILFDESVLTFNGITNVVPEGSGTYSTYIPNPPRVGLSWFTSGSSGVDFPDGKYLDMEFTFHGGYTDLLFSPGCEVTDWDVIPIDVTYVNGRVSSPSITFNLNVFLQGAYDNGTGTMKMDLMSSGYFPLVQPFNPLSPYYGNNSPSWLYDGNESIASVPDGVVDWVLVELRDASSANLATETSIIARKPCLLLSDGSIVDLDGTSNPQFFTSFNQGAFVVIWHRNHLGIMNSEPAAGFGGSYSYDFTTSESKVAGGGAGYVELGNGRWGMASGDLNADKSIDIMDKNTAWFSDAATQGYSGADANLDVQVDNPDKNEFILINIGKTSGIPD